MLTKCRAFVNFICHRKLSSFFARLPEHKSLVIEKFGDPVEDVVLRRSKPEDILPKQLGPKQVLVRHLAACINPADINVIQGVYGVKPKLPAVLGNEGITQVEEVGSQVTNLRPGDFALGVSALGSYWQSYSVRDTDSMYKIDAQLNPTTAAQLKINPCTAYRMIKDYRFMKSDDVLLQNGANSAVGVYAIQLAKHWGFKSINVIRDRPNKTEVIDELMSFGADYVLTEEQIRDQEIVSPILSKIGKPKLLLNCVSGKNANNCLRLLEQGGHCVTYGFMSKQPLMIGASSMFKDHKICFFWMSRWYDERQSSPDRRGEISTMLKEISDMFDKGLLKPKPCTVISFEDRNQAFSSPNNTKYIFSINEPNK